MNDDQEALNDIARGRTKLRQATAAALMDLYGGQKMWFDACRARRAADHDFHLARIIVRLMRTGGDAGPLRCRWPDRKSLATDTAIEAFWESVSRAGPSGWREERQRVKDVAAPAGRSADETERLNALDTNAVQSLLPTYRTGGEMLIGAAAMNDDLA